MSTNVIESAAANQTGQATVTTNDPTGLLMKAGRWSAEEQKVVIQEVPIPEPGPNQFLVKTASASLCHSDMMSIEAGNTVTLGHEGAGVIEKIDDSVAGSGFEIGDKASTSASEVETREVIDNH